MTADVNPEEVVDEVTMHEATLDEIVSEEVLDTDTDAADTDTDTDAVDVSFDLSDEAAVDGEPVGEEEEPAIVDDPWTKPGQWYVVHTQSGYEKKVTANLTARIQSMNMEEKIYEIVIPMEEVDSRAERCRPSSPPRAMARVACPLARSPSSITRWVRACGSRKAPSPISPARSQRSTPIT